MVGITVSNSILAIAGILSAVLFLLTLTRKNTILVTLLLFIGAIANVYYHTYKFDQFYQVLTKDTSCKRGTISNIEQHHHIIYKYKFFINGTFSCNGSEKNGIVCVYTKTKPIDLEVGDIVYIPHLKIKKPSNPSFNTYLLKEGISATSYINELNAQKMYRPTYSLARYIWNLKNNQLVDIKKKMNKKTFMLYSSLFLGNRSVVKNELDKHTIEFKTWGIMHYLARSGLHMVIFSMVLFMLLSCLPCSLWIRYTIILLLSIIYTLLSWSSISFLRALVMFLLYIQALLLKKYSNGLHILIVTCFATLLYNPFYLYFLDFQLSFFCTFILAFINRMRQIQKPVVRRI